MALTDNIQGYWKFDESSGDAADATPNGNTLTNINSATFVPAVIANGIDLEAGSSQRFTRANGSLVGLGFTGDLTLAGWVNFETVADAGLCAKFSAVSGTDRSWNFRMGGATAIGLRIVYDGAGSNFTSSVSWSPSTATWYYIAVTKSGTTIKFYVNGSQQGTDQTGASSAINTSTVPFMIGAQESDGGGPMDGKMDEWGAWNRALSGSEISQLYNGGAGLTYPFAASGPANLKSLDTNVKANIKSYNTNVLANIKSINTNA